MSPLETVSRLLCFASPRHLVTETTVTKKNEGNDEIAYISFIATFTVTFAETVAQSS